MTLASAAPAPQLKLSSASVAGTYHYKTYRPGQDGYDNTLEIEDKGGGRLRVRLSATYLYQANGAETMHEGSGEGDAILRGNVATADITPDGGEGQCRVLIIFEGNEAGVKADNACGFNVEVNGAYRNEQAGPAVKTAAFAAAGMAQVRYDKLANFVNEHQTNRTGVRFVVTSVPAEKISRVTPAGKSANRGRLFYLMTDENDDNTSTSFVTSAELASRLRAVSGGEAATLRVTATLVEFVGAFDVYRSSFVTRIEAFDDGGAPAWVVTGDAPIRTRMRQ
jgi:hypothetical protein